jgi:hypothetical protein
MILMSKTGTKQDKDNIFGIKERLRLHDVKSVQGINRGTVGLAKSLYLNSQFN